MTQGIAPSPRLSRRPLAKLLLHPFVQRVSRQEKKIRHPAACQQEIAAQNQKLRICCNISLRTLLCMKRRRRDTANRDHGVANGQRTRRRRSTRSQRRRVRARSLSLRRKRRKRRKRKK